MVNRKNEPYRTILNPNMNISTVVDASKRYEPVQSCPQSETYWSISSRIVLTEPRKKKQEIGSAGREEDRPSVGCFFGVRDPRTTRRPANPNCQFTAFYTDASRLAFGARFKWHTELHRASSADQTYFHGDVAFVVVQ